MPPDPLKLRLDFHEQAVTMTLYEGEVAEMRLVSALDVAHALSRELSYGTGLLPDNALWWTNTSDGAVTALYVAPGIRRLALQDNPAKPPRRFNIPLPGLIFVCTPGKPPAVFAVKKRPQKPTDIVYHAPLCNIFQNGNSCPGNHKFPADVAEVPESFLRSFFSATATLGGRSKKHPDNVVKLWKALHGRGKYPLDDLEKFGTVQDLMQGARRDD